MHYSMGKPRNYLSSPNMQGPPNLSCFTKAKTTVNDE